MENRSKQVKHHTLLAIAALVLMANPITAAHAGDSRCTGYIDAGPEWTTILDDSSSELCDDQYGPPAPSFCRFKTKSPLGQRILRVCPEASECTLALSINNNSPSLRYDQTKDGNFVTILKWPVHGVTCENGCGGSGRAWATGTNRRKP